MIKNISILPKISFFFGFVGVLILNFVLNKAPQYYLLMQTCFFFYNSIQLIFSFLMHKKYLNDYLIDMNPWSLDKVKAFKFEIFIFSMYLIFTVSSVILYLFF